MREFFKKYQGAYGVLDPLPLFIKTLMKHDDTYNVFEPLDPYDTLQRILTALVDTQGAEKDFLNKLFTSNLFRRSIRN